MNGQIDTSDRGKMSVTGKQNANQEETIAIDYTPRRMGGSITRRTGACLPHRTACVHAYCGYHLKAKEHVQLLLEHHKSKPSTRSNGFRPLYVWSGHGTRFVLGYECWEMACPSHMPPGLPIYLDPTGKLADVEYANFECMRGM